MDYWFGGMWNKFDSFLSPFLHSKNNEIFEIVVYRIKVNEATGKFGDNKKSNSYY